MAAVSSSTRRAGTTPIPTLTPITFGNEEDPDGGSGDSNSPCGWIDTGSGNTGGDVIRVGDDQGGDADSGMYMYVPCFQNNNDGPGGEGFLPANWGPPNIGGGLESTGLGIGPSGGKLAGPPPKKHPEKPTKNPFSYTGKLDLDTILRELISTDHTKVSIPRPKNFQEIIDSMLKDQTQSVLSAQDPPNILVQILRSEINDALQKLDGMGNGFKLLKLLLGLLVSFDRKVDPLNDNPGAFMGAWNDIVDDELEDLYNFFTNPNVDITKIPQDQLGNYYHMKDKYNQLQDWYYRTHGHYYP